MLTRGAILDVIAAHLRIGTGKQAAAPRKVPELRRRTFLSDYQLRRLLRPGARELRVPADAILSPLAMDWIDFNGIKVIRE